MVRPSDVERARRRPRRAVMGAGVTVTAALLLAGCATPPLPAQPSVFASPGRGKTPEQFHQDDDACRQYAAAMTNHVSPSAAATQSGVGSAVLGTLVGAGIGAALGSLGGAVGAGAAIGGASGLLIGGSAAPGASYAAGAAVQQHYDYAYSSCMVADGHIVQAPYPGRPYVAYAPPYPPPYYPPPPGY